MAKTHVARTAKNPADVSNPMQRIIEEYASAVGIENTNEDDDVIAIPDDRKLADIQRIYNARQSEIRAIATAFSDAVRGIPGVSRVSNGSYSESTDFGIRHVEYLRPRDLNSNAVEGDELKTILQEAIEKLKKTKIPQHDMDGVATSAKRTR